MDNEVTAKCVVCRLAIVPRPGAMCGSCYQKSVAESEDQARRIGLRKSITVEEIARELNVPCQNIELDDTIQDMSGKVEVRDDEDV